MSYVDGEDALGIGLYCGEPGRAALTLDCGATAELAGGKVGLRPILDPDGRLAGLVAEVSVEALVMETTTQLDLSSDSAREELESELAQRAGTWVYNILNKSISLGLDFLGIGQRLEREQTELWRSLPEPWKELLPELELEVRTSAEILNIREFAGPPDWYGGVN